MCAYILTHSRQESSRLSLMTSDRSPETSGYRSELHPRRPSTRSCISRRLGLRFTVSIGPAEQPSRVRPRKSDVVQKVSDDEGTRLLVAAG